MSENIILIHSKVNKGRCSTNQHQLHSICDILYNIMASMLRFVLITLVIIPMVVNGMEIFVKTLTGKKLTLEVEQEDMINTVKQKVLHELGIPTRQQRLVFAGKSLKDDRTLHDYKIRNKSSLYLIIL